MCGQRFVKEEPDTPAALNQPLSTGEKIGVGIVSLPVLGCCGPFLFVTLTLTLAFITFIPLAIFFDPIPDWLGQVVLGVAVIIALVITIFAVMSGALAGVMRGREKDFIRRADLKRAQRELEDDTKE